MVGVNLTTSGIEKINTNRSYIVVGNHPSTLDVFTHIHSLPVSIRFLTKTELFRIPFFGRVLKILGLPRIDRKNAQLNLPQINKSISNVIADGNSIMIFPEGTRSNQKELLPFKKGAANISQNFNLPILPVVSHNSHNLMIKGKVWFKKGDVHLDILDPIENVSDYTTDELTDLIYNRINKVLNS
jgi:1-acyl-sn-glycerol-3-phosphate acyltransferase